MGKDHTVVKFEVIVHKYVYIYRERERERGLHEAMMNVRLIQFCELKIY